MSENWTKFEKRIVTLGETIGRLLDSAKKRKEIEKQVKEELKHE